MTHSDPLDNPRLAAVLDELRAEFGPAPVQPDARLAALFHAHPPATAGSFIAIHPVRRRPMVSDVLKSLPGKVAAGFVGATLAWSGLGIAGAVPGPLSLAADDTEVACPAEDDTTTTATEDETTVDDSTAADESTTVDVGTTEECVADDDGSADEGTTEDDSADDDSADDDADEADDDSADDEAADDGADDAGELPAVPTTVSEAAHIHDFDDECGNHGTYVSHFARTSTEPTCASEARNGDGTTEDDDADDVGTDSVDAKADKKAAKDEAKDEKRSGKGKGKGGKGKRR